MCLTCCARPFFQNAGQAGSDTLSQEVLWSFKDSAVNRKKRIEFQVNAELLCFMDSRAIPCPRLHGQCRESSTWWGLWGRSRVCPLRIHILSWLQGEMPGAGMQWQAPPLPSTTGPDVRSLATVQLEVACLCRHSKLWLWPVCKIV